MSSLYWLETDRCRLRRFTLEDSDWFRGFYADVEVTRHLGGPKSVAEADDLLRTRVLDYYEAHPGLGIWATIERATGTCLGFHLLNAIRGERSFSDPAYADERPMAWFERDAVDWLAERPDP